MLVLSLVFKKHGIEVGIQEYHRLIHQEQTDPAVRIQISRREHLSIASEIAKTKPVWPQHLQ